MIVFKLLYLHSLDFFQATPHHSPLPKLPARTGGSETGKDYNG